MRKRFYSDTTLENIVLFVCVFVLKIYVPSQEIQIVLENIKDSGEKRRKSIFNFV